MQVGVGGFRKWNIQWRRLDCQTDKQSTSIPRAEEGAKEKEAAMKKGWKREKNGWER